MRLYYGKIARATDYRPAYDEYQSQFVLHFDGLGKPMAIYESPTFEGIIEQLKIAGHQIWGNDVLDYGLPPRNAYEYELATIALKARGLTDDEIAEAFSLNIKTSIVE